MIACEGPNTAADCTYNCLKCPTSSTMQAELPVNTTWNPREKKEKQWGTVNRWTKGRRFK